MPPFPQNDRDYPGKMKACHGNIGSGQHQGAAGEKTVGPGICLRKRVSPVPFPVPFCAAEDMLLPVDGQGAGDGMLHTVDTVAAFQKRNQGKRSHNVIAKGSEPVKMQLSGKIQSGNMQVKTDSFFAKNIISKDEAAASFLILSGRQPDAVRGFLRNQLEGAVAAGGGLVVRGDDG